MSRHESEHFAKDIGPGARVQRGLSRRMRIRQTSGPAWQVTGHQIMGNLETVDAEPFTGVGFYARPRASSKAEAVLLTIGDAKHSVIIATRDEDLRKLWKAELDAGADVTAIFNSATIVLIKPDGTVEIRSRGGVARALAFKDELEAVDAKYANHLHATNGSGPVSTVLPNPAFPATSPDPLIPGLPLGDVTIDGTQVLMGE